MSKIKDPLPGIEGLMPGVKDGGLTIINLKDEPIKRKPQFKLAIVTSVRLTESEWSDLVDEADRQELKPSALIRIMVKEYIKGGKG